MILESADTLRAIGWYLIAQYGAATVRVQSGMALGQDAAGELSLKPEEPLVEFTLADDGGLLLTAVSSIYELQVSQQAERTRSLHLAPDAAARIAFLNNSLAIATDFMTAAHSDDTLEIRIVPIKQHGTVPLAITKLMDGRKRPPEEIDGEILVPEAGLGRSPLQTASNFVRTKLAALPQMQSFSTSSGVFAGVVMATLVIGGLYLTSPERAGMQQARPRMEQATIDTPVAAPQIAPSVEIVKVETDNPVLVSVSALLDQTQLPNESTINFALQSLKALLTAYPNDPQVQQGLQQLANRLTQEARLSYDQGDVASAERLLAQAAGSGVALEEISEALVYISTPQAARAPQPARSPIAQVSGNAPREETPASARIPEPSPQAAKTVVGEPTEPLTRTAAREAPTATATIAAREPTQAFDTATAEQPDPDAAPAPAIEPILALVAPKNRLAEPALPLWERTLSTQATPRSQPAGGTTAITTAPATSAPPGGAATPALYPLAQLTAVRRPSPTYPRMAPEGAEGSVEIVMTVTKSGTVQNVEVRGNPPGYFARSATRAVKRWRFLPVLENGQPVAVRTTVRLTFRG